MIKYYTMKEAIEIMEPGDLFLPEKKCYSDMEMNSATVMICVQDRMQVSMSKMNLSIIGRIKRVEPKVLSAEEIFNENFPELCFLTERRVWVYGEAMDKNGQLREWLRPAQAELRQAIAVYCRNSECEETFYRLNDALENLKPPYEEQ